MTHLYSFQFSESLSVGRVERGFIDSSISEEEEEVLLSRFSLGNPALPCAPVRWGL